jgi:hypothetical protein
MGKHVRNLKLVLSSRDLLKPPTGDLIFSAVLGHCRSLKKLTIEYEDHDTASYSLLVQALSTLTQLEALHILRSEYYVYSSLTSYHISSALNHRLLNAIVDHHCSRLRSLSLNSLTPLHASTYRKIRDTATHLREIYVTRDIDVELRSVLAEPQRWACAGHLQHIRLVDCQGVHAAIFSNQLAAGIFGHPRTVYLSACGDNSDQEDLPRAPKWNIPRLELLQLDHFALWEMNYLGQIHTQVVRINQTWQHGCEQLIEALKDAAMFPGVQVLKIVKWWEEEYFGDLQEACRSRGINAVELVEYQYN